MAAALVGEEEEEEDDEGQLLPSICVLAMAWYHKLALELDANFEKSLAL